MRRYLLQFVRLPHGNRPRQPTQILRVEDDGPSKGTLIGACSTDTEWGEALAMVRGLRGTGPMDKAPKDRYILLVGESGYSGTPHRFAAGRWLETAAAKRWVTHSGDAFTEDGGEPLGWFFLPTEGPAEAPLRATSKEASDDA